MQSEETSKKRKKKKRQQKRLPTASNKQQATHSLRWAGRQPVGTREISKQQNAISKQQNVLPALELIYLVKQERRCAAAEVPGLTNIYVVSLSSHEYAFAIIMDANNYYINYVINWILMQEKAENNREELSEVL